MSEEKFTINIDDLLCTLEPKIFNKFENGKMSTYGYSIKRDRNGVEVSRTEPVFLSAIGWDDGTDFTADDKFCVENGISPRGKSRFQFDKIPAGAIIYGIPLAISGIGIYYDLFM